MTPNVDGKVTNVKKSAKFHHSHWRFHCVQFEATAWTGEIFPFLTAIKCQEVSNIPSFRTWATHPQFGLLWAPNKENLRVNATLFGRMASVVTEHNFTAQISFVRSTLAFSLAEMRPYRPNLIFISGLMQFNFPAENWSIMRPSPYIYALYSMRILC